MTRGAEMIVPAEIIEGLREGGATAAAAWRAWSAGLDIEDVPLAAPAAG